MRNCSGKKICIICEGYEELEYFEAFVGKGVFSRKYDFITVNSKSINTIISRYQDKIVNLIVKKNFKELIDGLDVSEYSDKKESEKNFLNDLYKFYTKKQEKNMVL